MLKVAGSALKGWLVDADAPARRIRFNLMLDGQLRGSFVANRRRMSLVRRAGSAEDTHGFLIPIRRAWISGGVQAIRLEEAGGAGLLVALAAKLGPAPHENFPDHVVGGQAVLAEPSRNSVESFASSRDEEIGDVPSGATTARLLKQIAALTDRDLVELLTSINRDIVLERIARYNKSDDWHGASGLRRPFLGPALEQVLIALGRGAMSAHNHALACRFAAAAAQLQPHSFEANFLAGLAWTQHGDFGEALRHFRVAEALEEKSVRVKREIALVLGKYLRAEISRPRRDELRAQQLEVLRALGTWEDPAVRARFRVPYVTALLEASRYDEAIEAADEALAAAPYDTSVLLVKARALIARNAVAEAQALCEHILELEPDHRGARMHLRVLTPLAAEAAPQPAVSARSGIRAGEGGPRGRNVPVVVLADDCDEALCRFAAAMHARQGLVPILVRIGRRGGLAEDGEMFGCRSITLGTSPAELKEYFLESGSALVHALPGTGHIVAGALSGTDVAFVCAVGAGEPVTEASQDDSPSARRDRLIATLARADAFYAVSAASQKAIEDSLGVRCPVIDPLRAAGV